jgi:hypothetical protein
MPNFLKAIFGARPNYSNVQSQLTNPTGPNTAYSQFAGIYPNLSTNIGQIGSNITSELGGQLPTDVTGQIKDQGAAWGLSTGMPGSGAADNYTLEDLGLTSLNEQQQGFSNYLNFAPSLQSMFTMGPGATTDILGGMDLNAAAPNPAAAGLEDYLSGLGGDILGAGATIGAHAV